MTSLAPAYTVDVERYRTDGYLTAPSVLAPERIEQMRREADRLTALCGAEPERYAARIEWERDHLDAPHRAGMERVIRKLEPISDLSPIFAALAFDEGIVAPIRELFGEPVELFEDKLNLKLPGGSPYPWHQDWHCCWQAHSDELITCFIYLEDADETNGCLQVAPGSHRGKAVYPFKPGSRFEIDPAIIRQQTIKAAPLRAGDMIFFDPYLLHYSDLNRGQTPRRAIIYTFNPARLGKINEGRFPKDQLAAR